MRPYKEISRFGSEAVYHAGSNPASPTNFLNNNIMAKITADKIAISICLSDIPKSAIVEAQNGKKYLSLDIIAKKETDQYGKNITVALSQTKEQREAKAETVWLGNGKTFVFEPVQQAQAQQQAPVVKQESANDLF